jgi:hypothetical protein
MTLFSTPQVKAAGLKVAGTVVVTAAAGLVSAACSAPGGHLHADSRPGAHPIPAGSSSPAHPAPTVVPSTTPAAPRSPHGGRRSSPAPAPTQGPPTSGPASPAPTGVAGPAPLPQCATAALRVSVGGANGAAGSIYYPLEFTNISGGRCVMYGYPGVSFVSAPGGRELGGAAVRNSTFSPAQVTLAPGAVAHASVQVEVAQNYPVAVCKPVTAHWLRVYPPGQYVPLYASLTAATCTGSIPGGSTLGIYVVRPGANGP